jgi:glycogen debranching enzyme
MDTNYPAGTPREGYPIEIQALWIRLLRQLDSAGAPHRRTSWRDLANRALQSFEKYFWMEEKGYYADCLLIAGNGPASRAVVDTSLRSNFLMAISLGLISGKNARRAMDAAVRYLFVPGALRSLAPLPVSPPLVLTGAFGQPLNDPNNPYCGRYEGDEDTRRKPAYHNGTAWTWTFPGACEALVKAWNNDPQAIAAARAYLSSVLTLLNEGCLGHLPEILDGDAPHLQRGCDAQAWGVTEAFRVWKWLQNLEQREKQ